MNPKYNLYRKGDVWNGRKYKFPFDLTGAVIVIQFKEEKTNTVAFEYKTSDGTITVPSPETDKEIILQPRIMNYPEAIYVYGIKITFPNNYPTTYCVDKLTIF